MQIAPGVGPQLGFVLPAVTRTGDREFESLGKARLARSVAATDDRDARRGV